MKSILLQIFLLTAAMGMSGCITVPLDRSARGKNMALEVIEEPESAWTSKQVLMVTLNGPLSAEPEENKMFSGPSDLVQMKDALDRARKNDNIKALLVRIDSPGGSVTASDLIYHELKRFGEEAEVPIIAAIMGVGASGGYYSAVAADHIVAHPTSLVGSIGVIGMFPNVQGLTNKVGVDMRILKSGEYKDNGTIWRSFAPEERRMLQDMIDSMHARFVDVVDQGRRNLTRDEVMELADGRLFISEEAKNNGLVDQVGYMEDAFEKAKELAGIEDAAMVAYRMPHGYKGHYYAQAEAPETPVNIFQVDLGALAPWPSKTEAGSGPLYYLWLP